MTPPLYELTAEADADIVEIAQYTISIWGRAQAARYGQVLEKHLQAIGLGEARVRRFLPHRPELRVSRAGRHFVFHLVRQGQCPLILTVLHDKMDLMKRLRPRLERGR